jgi:hypothetical protein
LAWRIRGSNAFSFGATLVGRINFLEQTTVKRRFVKPLLVAFGVAFSGLAMAADAPAGASGVYATEGADGSVELSNLSASGDQQPVVAAPADAGTAAPADAQTSGGEPQKDPREQYRDNLIKSEQGTAGATSNASRRYKMMDKATYQATVLGNPPPAPAK